MFADMNFNEKIKNYMIDAALKLELVVTGHLNEMSKETQNAPCVIDSNIDEGKFQNSVFNFIQHNKMLTFLISCFHTPFHGCIL